MATFDVKTDQLRLYAFDEKYISPLGETALNSIQLSFPLIIKFSFLSIKEHFSFEYIL